MLIFHGTVDPLVPLDQSQRLYDRLKQEGIEAQFIKFEGEGHGFVKPESIQRLMATAGLFLTMHLQAP
jgi:dipeptidyl aminopeptidase/acylaminoacyl peptidase